jgi:hypothetical protein
MEPVKYDNFFSPENAAFYASRQYKSLETTRKEIRLLSILPGEGGDPIICEIHDNLPMETVSQTYLALSYCAGDHHQTMKICVNGVAFNVFAGLGAALQRIRLDEEALAGRMHMIWTDQICINQSDPVERAHQVLLMRDIYHNSGRVMVWLGEDLDKTRLYFLRHHYQNMREILDSVKGEPDSKEAGDNDLPGAENTPEALLEFATTSYARLLLDYIDDERFARNWQSLRGFAAKPWWSRGWICQEIIVATSATLMFGNDAMDWKEFCTVWPAIRKAVGNFIQALQDDLSLLNGPVKEMLTNCGLSQFERIDFLLDMQEAWHKHSSRKIGPVLESARSCQVTDPRDKVYAFLGLVDSGYRIEPDYHQSNSLSDLFCYTCKRAILFEECLDILSHAQENVRSLDNDLPSWVPDWSSTRDRALLQTSDTHFKASGDHKAVVSFGKSSNSKSNRVLRTQCLMIDRLAREDTLVPGNEDNPVRARNEWISLMQRHFGTLEAMVDSMAEVFWRGDGDVLASEKDEENDSSGQLKEQNQRIRNHRKSLVDESVGGNWNFFISPEGYVGLAHSRARHSDQICILPGASVPFILRREDDHYLLVGEAYVHGLMKGEAIKLLQNEKVEVKYIEIW